MSDGWKTFIGFACVCVVYIGVIVFTSIYSDRERERTIEDAEQKGRFTALCEDRGGVIIDDECLQKDSIVKIEVK
jgi:hypothetical protein